MKGQLPPKGRPCLSLYSSFCEPTVAATVTFTFAVGVGLLVLALGVTVPAAAALAEADESARKILTLH